jgi:UDP-glucose 4-epimerase
VDLAKGHVSALDAIDRGTIYDNVKKEDGKNRFRAFNLGTGQAYSVKQMIEAMRKASGFEYQYEVVGRRSVL